MSAQNVYDSQLGKLEWANRTANKYGVTEQWVYNSGN